MDMRSLEQLRRPVLNGIYPPPVLHQRGQVLCHRETLRLPECDHQEECGRHAGHCLGVLWSHKLHPDLLGMVHHRRTSGREIQKPEGMRVRGQQALRSRFLLCLLLGAQPHNDRGLCPNLLRSYQAGEDDLRQPDRGRHPAVSAQQYGHHGPDDGHHAPRPPQFPRQRMRRAHHPHQEEHQQDEERAQGGQDSGHHHGSVHLLLATFLHLVRDRESL